MSKLIAVYLSMAAVIALLLLGIAGVLIWAPGLMLGFLHIGIIVVSVIAGIYFLIPLFVILVATLSNGKREKGKYCEQTAAGCTYRAKQE